MRALYESILDSDEKISQYASDMVIKNLILNPIGKEDQLNKLWKKLDLSFDAGWGEGYWYQLPNEHVTYFVPIIKKAPKVPKDGIGLYRLALTGKEDLASDIVILTNSAPVIHRSEIKKWAEKVAKSLHMDLHIEKYCIYLNFA